MRGTLCRPTRPSSLLWVVEMRPQLILRCLFLVAFLWTSVTGLKGSSKPAIDSVFQWKTIAYGPTDKSEKELVGGFPYLIRENIIPTALAYHTKTSMLFIAAPRIRPGVIATLNSIDLYDTYHLLSPIWTPYPSAKMNDLQVRGTKVLVSESS